MAPLGYNPFDKQEGGGKAVEGDYTYKVDECTEVTFRSGNKGLKLRLMVGAFESRDITVYCNLVYTPTALWKLEQFMASVGLDFQDPNVEAADFFGRCGRAHFKPEGEKGYLAAVEFYPASANTAPGAKPAAKTVAASKAPQAAAASADEPF